MLSSTQLIWLIFAGFLTIFLIVDRICDAIEKCVYFKIEQSNLGSIADKCYSVKVDNKEDLNELVKGIENIFENNRKDD